MLNSTENKINVLFKQKGQIFLFNPKCKGKVEIILIKPYYIIIITYWLW